VLRAKDDVPAAQAQYREALRVAEIALGPVHLDVAKILNNLAASQMDCRQYAGARMHLRRALRISETELGPEHPETGSVVHNLASVHSKLGDRTTAIELHERALHIAQAAHGLAHPEVAKVSKGHADTLLRSGDPASARVSYERALAIWRARQEPIRQAEVLADLALAEFDLGNHADAKSSLCQAISLLQQDPPSELESACYFELGRMALQDGRRREGLLLVVIAFLVGKLVGLADDQERHGRLMGLLAGVGVDDREFQDLLIQVEAAYKRDQGQGLLQAMCSG